MLINVLIVKIHRLEFYYPHLKGRIKIQISK
jgi:hypothetical protein